MRKISLSLLFVLSVYLSNAQQLHFMSQYLQHNSMLNPGAAGMSDKTMVGLSYRNQWASFPGSPKTVMLYGDVNLKKLNAGIGTYIYKDETGPTSRTGVQLAYSYHIISKDKKHKFGLGLELRGLQYAINRSKIQSALTASPALGGVIDPVLGGASNKVGIDAGAGAYYTNGKLTAGIAVSQLIQSKLQLSDVPNATLNGKLYRHYNIIANYEIKTADNIKIIPNALVRVIQNSPTEFEAGAKLDYQEKLWVAIVARLQQSFSLQFGFNLTEKLKLSYSYDTYSTPISAFDGGSGAHEIGLRFDIKK